MTLALTAREGQGRLVAALLAVSAVAVIVGGARPANAGETDTFRLEPHPLKIHGLERRTFALAVPPGGSAQDAVRLTNLSDEKRRFRVYAADATLDERSGAATVEEFGATRDGVGEWITVAAPEVAVAPGASEVVAFAVRRPPGQPAAGVGAVVAEEITEGPDGPGIAVSFRLAILVRVGGARTGVVVDRPVVDLPAALLPSVATVRTRVANDTLAPVTASVALAVESVTGRRWQLQTREVTLAPGEEREVAVPWETVPRWGGVLRPVAAVSWDAGAATARGRLGAHPPGWLVAVAIAALGRASLRQLRAGRRGADAPEPAGVPAGVP